ncbi:hypothetical protein GCM10009092_19210 [Bowmanella denitrificans]|uniref:PNPLA domain-containing protein n=1 Tax=Bowmanella denitrificans TaxID=366582 RepID=A0ABP3GUI3_9ALTE
MPQSRTPSTNAWDTPVGDSTQGQFAQVYAEEANLIALRRRNLGVQANADASKLSLPESIFPSNGFVAAPVLDGVLTELEQTQPAWQHEEAENHCQPRQGLIGLALSGGGIRSSTFNLGVMQAVQRAGLFPYMDYLSTVSGGGYIGTYLTTSIQENLSLGESPMIDSTTSEQDRADPFPFVHQTGQVENSRFRHLRNYASYLTPQGRAQLLFAPLILLRGFLINLLAIAPLMLGAALCLFVLLDYQSATGNFVFAWEPWLAEQLLAEAAGVYDLKQRVLLRFPLSLLALALLVGYFFSYPLVHFRDFWRGVTENTRRGARMARLKRYRAFFLIFVAAVALESMPLLMEWLHKPHYWLACLGSVSLLQSALAQRVLVWLKAKLASMAMLLAALILMLLLLVAVLFVAKMMIQMRLHWQWVLVFGGLAFVYALVFVDINATSIHKYYKDHLVKAFVAQAAADDAPDPNRRGQWVPRLSELKQTHQPYHLLNVTLNMDWGDKDNQLFKNGRRASFFIFSKFFCGGPRCGYVPTEQLEKVERDLDIGTAMAISGAAVAPNMGRVGNPWLGFLFAFFNVRLNYWLRNPMQLDKQGDKVSVWYRPGPLYLLREMLQRLGSERPFVNLSDGGHIENTGIYELLRRQCRLIIAGDGECDTRLTFGGLAEVIRLARIDFGFRIQMDGLDELRAGEQRYAIGTIYYHEDWQNPQNNRIGKLIYLKSNLGGDYNLAATLNQELYRTSAGRDDDYLFDRNAYLAFYRSMHPDFPHETTADQLFDEAQFESYRALGFQVAASALLNP